MSYDQILYKAPCNTKPMKKWDKDYSVSMGNKQEIKNMFQEILGDLKWNDSNNGGYWAEGCYTKHGFEISIPSKDTHIISLDGCSQSQAIEIAKKLNLLAFDPQTGEQLVE